GEQGIRSWRQASPGGAGWPIGETSKSVGLNDEQTPAPDIRNAVQLTSLADSGGAVDALMRPLPIFIGPISRARGSRAELGLAYRLRNGSSRLIRARFP